MPSVNQRVENGFETASFSAVMMSPPVPSVQHPPSPFKTRRRRSPSLEARLISGSSDRAARLDRSAGAAEDGSGGLTSVKESA